MNLTPRGRIFASLATVLLFTAALFRDVILGGVFSVVLILLVSEAVSVRVAIRRPASFRLQRVGEDPGVNPKKILFPGDANEESVTLSKTAGGRLTLEPRVAFLAVEPPIFEGIGTFSVNMRFSTPYSGEYSADSMPLLSTGPLGLFSSRGSIPFRQDYVVYPRLLQVATATIRLLGKGEIGETPIEMPGVGTEYYEMRDYQPGDDFRKVNWKATARQGELMVVEKMREVGASYLLVLDSRAPGLADSDRLASTFLLLANSLASAGVSFGVLVHDGEKVTAVTSDDNPRSSLEVALKASVSTAKLEAMPEFLELIPARSPRHSAVGEGSVPRGLNQFSVLFASQMKGILQSDDPWSSASRYIRDGPTKNVLYVSELVSRPEPVIELAWQARHFRDVSFTILDPSRRFEPAEDPKGHAARQRFSASLASMGISYLRGEPQEVTRRALG